jgi:hypothetical protein
VIARRALVTPVTIAAIAVLVVNDHVLKAAFPGWWTGKLSDVAGLAFFPLLVAAAAEAAGARGVRVTVLAAIATGAGFAAVKTLAVAGDAYRIGLGALQWPARALVALAAGDPVPALAPVHLTADPTDLLALPALAIPVALAIRASAPASGRSSPCTARRTPRTA